MTIGRDRRVVLVYFLALLITVVASAGLVIGLTFSRYQGEADSREKLERYHLRSLLNTGELQYRLGEATALLSGSESSTVPFGLATERGLANIAFAVDEATADLLALQERSGQPSFESTVERARAHALAIQGLVDDGNLTPTDWQQQLSALGLTVFQLNRLHSIAVEDELGDIARRNDQVRSLAFVAVPLGLLVGAVLLVRLFRLVRRRLGQLEAAHQRLEQSEKLDALGTLVGGVAHDFNNLLMVILLQAEVGRGRLDPDHPAHGSLEQIQLAGERAANTTRQLLAFSAQQPIEPEVVDLDLLIRNVEPILRSLLRSDIELVVGHSPTVSAVRVDPVQMDQTLMNLVLNARDAMPTGGRVTIRTDDVEVAADEEGIAAGPYRRLRVEDGGCGMPDHVRSRVFDPFFTTKDAGRGSGLGLSMVHGIVSKSDGYIRIESEVGAGTTVDIFLPRVGAVAALAQVAELLSDLRGSETILVVEDETQIRELVSDELRAHGYRVFSASDGAAALAVCRDIEGPLDLVLTDVVMPGARGPEVVASLREIHPGVVAVYMSGYTEESVLAAVLASGDRFVAKPFKLRDVLNAVREGLDGRRSHPRAPPLPEGRPA